MLISPRLGDFPFAESKNLCIHLHVEKSMENQAMISRLLWYKNYRKQARHMHQFGPSMRACYEFLDRVRKFVCTRKKLATSPSKTDQCFYAVVYEDYDERVEFILWLDGRIQKLTRRQPKYARLHPPKRKDLPKTNVEYL